MERDQRDNGTSDAPGGGPHHGQERDTRGRSRSPLDDRDQYFDRSRKHDNSKDYRAISPGEDFFRRRYVELLQETDLLREENRMLRKKLAENKHSSPRRHRSKSPQQRKRSRSPDSSHRTDDRLRLSGREDMAIDTNPMRLIMPQGQSVGGAEETPKRPNVHGRGRRGRPARRSGPSLPSQQETTETVQDPPKFNWPPPGPARKAKIASFELPDVDDTE